MLKQLIAVLDPLDGRIAVIQFFPFGDGHYKIPAQMRLTAAAFDIRQIVIPLITVRLQIPGKTIQKSFRIKFCPGFGIFLKNDGRQTIFPGTEKPHERVYLSLPLRHFEHLDPCFVHHQELPFYELPVEIFIQRRKVIPGAVNNPVGQGCPV